MVLLMDSRACAITPLLSRIVVCASHMLFPDGAFQRLGLGEQRGDGLC